MRRIDRILTGSVLILAAWLIIHFRLAESVTGPLDSRVSAVVDGVRHAAELELNEQQPIPSGFYLYECDIDLLHALSPLQLPSLSVIGLGCYALYCVGIGLWNFGDAGNAAESLTQVRKIYYSWSAQ